MAILHGKGTKTWLNAFDLSAYFNEATATRMADVAETTTFGQGAKTFIAGLADGKVSLKGLFDGGAGALDSVLNPLIAAPTDSVFTYAPGSSAVGQSAMLGLVEVTSYETSSPVSDVVTASVEAQSDGGIDSGRILLSAQSAAFGATTNGTGVDNTAASTNGGIATAHVTSYALTAGTTTVKVQHSSDNSTYVDLATVVNGAAAVTSGSAVVAPGTTVNRYVRGQVTNTGSAGTTTTTVAFARR